MVSVGHAVNELVGAGRLTGPFTFFLRGVGIAPAQVIQDGAGEQGIFLQDHGNLISQNLRVVISHVHSAYADGPLVHIVEPAD